MKFKVYILLLLFFPIISVFIGLNYKINLLTSIIFFFVVPSLWLTFRLGKSSVRPFIFALICGIGSTIVIEPIAIFSRIWTVKSIFDFKFLGVELELFLWGFFYVYLIVIFYEYFFPIKSRQLINKKMFLLCLIFLFGFLITRFIMLYFPLLLFKYFYFFSGVLIFMLPLFVVCSKFPKIRGSVFKTAIYFLFLDSCYEFVSLRFGLWTFPGDINTYLVTYKFLNTTFPMEEFLYFSILASPAILSYYFLFDISEDELA